MYRLIPIFLIAAGCSYPELARTPDKLGETPRIAPLSGSLVASEADAAGTEAFVEGNQALEARAANLRRRAGGLSNLPDAGSDADLRNRAEALRLRAAEVPATMDEAEAPATATESGQP